MKALLLICGLGAAISAGVLLAFSSFVMSGLARIAPASGISAMQSINITVINPVFMGIYFGTGLLAVIAAVLAGREGIQATGLVYAGTAIYLLGVLLVTIAFNVPMNDQLASLDANSAQAAQYWKSYLSNWTMWNHVRCVASVVAAAFILFARG
jgi:uncharacterized membrane protein